MSNRPERTFKILIYESEYRQIQAWTRKFQNLETGGDLFGLWHDERTAVVQLVLGPGKRCRRTSTSFYQDVEYLRRMCDTLTSEEGLCHIGEWHSHHRLSLTRPSGGDESTIWSNMDRYGLSCFVLCIANISTSWSWFSYVPDETTVNGFLFEVDRQRQYHRRLPVLQAVEFIFLEEESPFRSRYLNIIQEGAESLNTEEDQLLVVVEKYKKMESEWKKVSQKLETSLEEERKARKETDIRLANSQHQAADLQSSLTAERKAKRETEKTVNSVVEKAHQLQSSLVAQTHAREDAERRLNTSEQQAHQLQSSLDEQTQAREDAERRLYNSEQQAHQLQSSLDAQTRAREESERRLIERSDQRVRELETSIAAVQQQLEESLRRSRELPRDWILERNEIIISPDSVIGVGGWGRVVEGTFGGCRVAVKEIHQVILSPYNRSLFEREMNIASKCRHPCLLQFIGATNDDQSPLFVTELLETSLRAVLQERPLEPAEITTIAMDVAKGLNYLHLKRPAPIIHRDVSSANVLLWKKGDDWRAKVSDYGTAKFLQDAMTVCPGPPIYSAPEAQTSTQSPKVDVYSFGVLLCEMNIGVLPDVQTRNQQIARVTNHFYRGLIRRCVVQNPEERPTMADLVEEIKDLH